MDKLKNLKQLNKYKIDSFNKSSIDRILSESEKGMLVVSHSNKEFYDRFMEDFSLFLSKLPNNAVKKYVQNLINRKTIYLATPQDNSKNVLAAIYAENRTKLIGIMLNTIPLKIDIQTGETPLIDDAIYVAYIGLIRAAILLNSKSSIKSNLDLHKLLTTYMYLVFIKTFGKNILLTKKQKNLIQYCCIYIYYVYFFGEKHTYALSKIKKDYSKVINMEFFDEFYNMMKDNKGYYRTSQLPDLFYDLHIISENPSKVKLSIFKMLGMYGAYRFFGPLDHFISLAIISKYPCSFFTRNSLTNDQVHNNIEKIINKYMNKIKYSTIEV